MGFIGRFLSSIFGSPQEVAPLTNRVESALSSGGGMERHMKGFIPRPGQIDLAKAWAQAVEEKGILCAEASTGIGKTLAYLAPAILFGKKTVVSTGTRILQDQIAEKDIPFLRKALEMPFSCAILKGRANYICQRRAKKLLSLRTVRPEMEQHLPALAKFLSTAGSGDISDCVDIPEGSMIFGEVVSRGEDCQGRDCPHSGSCYLQRARKKTADADVVITNHHLLFASVVGGEKGSGESDLLPKFDVLILDEAHGIEPAAAEAFGVTVSSADVSEILYGFRGIYALGEEIRNSATDFKAAAGAMFKALPGRQGRASVPASILEGEADRVLHLLQRFMEAVDRARKAKPGKDAEVNATLRLSGKFAQSLAAIKGSRDGKDVIWCERAGRVAYLRLTPADVSGHLSGKLFSKNAAILVTSATLSVSGNLEFFRKSVGLSDNSRVREIVLSSEFDHAGRSMFYVPTGLPDPREAGYVEAAARQAAQVISISGGGGLVLCASHKSMNAIAEYLRENTSFRVLLQGEMPRAKLLAEFKADIDSVLVGTASFRDGVDVRGPSLRCVIIDKLPFAPPDDPVATAKTEALKKAGRDSFSEYHLPTAILALRQGVGRLLRRNDDYGVVALLDPRMYTKPYGTVVRESLPGAPWTRDLADVASFYRKYNSGPRLV